MTEEHDRCVQYNLTVSLTREAAEKIEADLVGLATSLAGRLERVEYEDHGPEVVRIVGGPDILVHPSHRIAYIGPSEGEQGKEDEDEGVSSVEGSDAPAWN